MLSRPGFTYNPTGTISIPFIIPTGFIALSESELTSVQGQSTCDEIKDGLSFHTVICSGYPPLPKSGVTLAAARRENFSSDFGRRSTSQQLGILREHGERYRGKCWKRIRSGPTAAVRDGEEICREV